MELFLLYCWLKLDAVCIMLAVTFLVLGVIYALLWIDRTDIFHRWSEEKKKHHNIIGTIALCCCVLSALVPSSKDVAILVAGSYAIDFVKSPEGTKVSTLIRGKANEILDAEMKKLTPPTPQPAK